MNKDCQPSLSDQIIAINKIGIECGFADITYFIRLFKQYEDLILAAFRNIQGTG